MRDNLLTLALGPDDRPAEARLGRLRELRGSWCLSELDVERAHRVVVDSTPGAEAGRDLARASSDGLRSSLTWTDAERDAVRDFVNRPRWFALVAAEVLAEISDTTGLHHHAPDRAARLATLALAPEAA